VQTNQDRFLTLQDLALALGTRDLRLDDIAVPRRAVDLGRALGATEIVAGEVWLEEGRWRIEARRLKASDGSQLGVAREEGSRGALPAIAYKAAIDLFPVHASPGPLTGSAAALELAAVCEAHLARHPLRANAEVTLPGDRLAAARRACVGALQADARLGLARAGYAITLALRGKLASARRQVRRAQARRFVPLAVLADAFALEKMGKARARREVLEQTVAEHHGFVAAAKLAEGNASETARGER
jgi:hypothetical protein